MKRVLIYEHLTGGGMAGQDLQMSWLMEGSAMRKAVVKAFQEAGCTVSTFQDSRLPLDINIEATQISDPLEIQPSLWSAMRATDHGILIAPETGGALADLVQWTQHVPEWSLGCTLDGVRLCTDKLECSKFLKANQISHPQSWTADHPDHPWTKSANFIVIKPRDGAGSLETFKTPNSFNISHLCNTDPAQTLIQQFHSGTSMSLSAICDGRGGVSPIGVCSHNLNPIPCGDNTWDLSEYEPANEPDFPVELLQNCLKTLRITPGLRGWVGVDFLWNAELETDMVIEINPRLTSSLCWIEKDLISSKIASQWLSIPTPQPL